MPDSFELPDDVRNLSVAEKERLLHRLVYDWKLRARPTQLEPEDENWVIWMLMSGRGSGKTRSGSEWIKEYALNPGLRTNQPFYASVMAPTFALCKSVCFEGESGLLRVLPPETISKWNRTELLLVIKRPDGGISEVRGFSSGEYERIRGSQCNIAWVDELASAPFAEESFDQLMFTMRLGMGSGRRARPRCLITTTPRPIPIVKSLVERDGQDVRLVNESTWANAANLPPEQLDWLRRRYAETYLGQQELLGRIIDDAPGALWTRQLLIDTKVNSAPEFSRVGVAIDPAVTSGEKSDETGIIAGGLGLDGHVYVTVDASGRYGPEKWARVAVNLYHDLQADFIVAETNNGGDLVINNIRTVDPLANVRRVTASRGKAIRAEPAASLFEQHRAHLVGPGFPTLEDQLCTMVPGVRPRGYSPDHADAMVWLLYELAVRHGFGNAGVWGPEHPTQPRPVPGGNTDWLFGKNRIQSQTRSRIPGRR